MYSKIINQKLKSGDRISLVFEDKILRRNIYNSLDKSSSLESTSVVESHQETIEQILSYFANMISACFTSYGS